MRVASVRRVSATCSCRKHFRVPRLEIVTEFRGRTGLPARAGPAAPRPSTRTARIPLRWKRFWRAPRTPTAAGRATRSRGATTTRVRRPPRAGPRATAARIRLSDESRRRRGPGRGSFFDESRRRCNIRSRPARASGTRARSRRRDRPTRRRCARRPRPRRPRSPWTSSSGSRARRRGRSGSGVRLRPSQCRQPMVLLKNLSRPAYASLLDTRSGSFGSS